MRSQARRIDLAATALALIALLLLLPTLVLAQATQPRVISLAPHLTELVYAVEGEDRLVGVVEYSDFPAAARTLPRIGDAFRFDLERILTLEADLALAWRGGTPPAVGDSLKNLGVEVVWIETRRLEHIPAALRQIASALGRDESGQRAARNFEGRLAELRTANDRDRPELSVFYQVSARPLYTLGGRHIINDVLALCGMRNIFEAIDVEAAVVGREAVLSAAPDLVLAATGASEPFEAWIESGLDSARLHTVDADLLIRPTPRILDGATELCRLRLD